MASSSSVQQPPLQATLKNLFPKENYTKELPKSLWPFYLMATGFPNKAHKICQEFIQKNAPITDPDYKLTYLAMAILAQAAYREDKEKSGNFDIFIQKLLDQTNVIVTQDNAGMTPLHWDAYCNNRKTSIARLLPSQSKVLWEQAEKIQNYVGHTPKELRDLIFQPDPPETVVCEMRTNTEAPRPLSSAEFFSRRRAEHCPFLAYPPLNEWLLQYLSKEFLPPNPSQKWNPSLQTNPPPIRLVFNSNGLVSVEATTNIHQGAIIGTYGSTYSPTAPQATWRLETLSASCRRAPITETLDGPPNAHLQQGFRYLALTEIPKNNPILIDYGPEHPVKLGPYLLTHPEKIICAAQTISLDAQQKECLNLWETFCYILWTPPALYFLVAKGVSLEKISETLEKCSLQNPSYERYKPSLLHAQDINKQMQELPLPVKEALQKKLLEWIPEYFVFAYLQYLAELLLYLPYSQEPVDELVNRSQYRLDLWNAIASAAYTFDPVQIDIVQKAIQKLGDGPRQMFLKSIDTLVTSRPRHATSLQVIKDLIQSS